MKSKTLGITSLHYLNKQNYSNRLISQSSAFVSNPATVCSLHSSQNDQMKIILILLHLCLKYHFLHPCPRIDWQGPHLISCHPSRALCTATMFCDGSLSPPDFCTGVITPHITSSFQANYAYPSARHCLSFSGVSSLTPPSPDHMYPPCALTVALPSLQNFIPTLINIYWASAMYQALI